MNRFRVLVLIASFAFLAGCSPSSWPGQAATPSPAPSPTPVTFAEDTARAFLKAWSEGDYAGMYALLAPSRQATLSAEQFSTLYKSTTTEATIKAITPTFSSAQENGDEAQAQFTVTLETNAVGTLSQTNTMALRREDSKWGVLWSPSLILSQLTDGGSVKFYPLVSTRGSILDRLGRPLAIDQPLTVVEVVPAEMKSESAVLAALAQVFGQTAAQIRSMYSKFPSGWRTAIGTLTDDQVKTNQDLLTLPGIHTDTRKNQRTYPHGEGGAHVVGYASQVSAEDLDTLAIKGYRAGDLLGRTGLEVWGQNDLAGRRGGKLVVLTPSGQITATLANVPAHQSSNLTTTLDADLTDIAEKALGTHNGTVIALDITNGNVLAMVSNPAFDPNKMTQRLSTADSRALLNDPNSPFLNRAVQSAFPPGSVFKIVTYAAALEKGVFTANTVFEDPGYWDGLGQNNRKYNWTWEITGKGAGSITLSSALTQSDDVVFYQVGYKLNQVDRNLMPSFAKAFGLGTATGIEIGEVPGNVPDPAALPSWGPGEAINLVIGQGTMLTSPLQIADMLAAVANGGTLYRPHLITKITNAADGTLKLIQPEVRGKLPVSAATLASIRDALKKVTTTKEGTAVSAFRGARVVSAGKTGTAEVLKNGDPHAWFAGYAPADNPKIAIVVMVEHGGEGSMAAAPIFREIVDNYLAPKK
jgi:penicillin-binding protein 2